MVHINHSFLKKESRFKEGDSMIEMYETSDIFKGAYLLCCGGTLESTHLKEGRQVMFTIEGENLKRLEMLFRVGQASVNPLQLREIWNFLRDLVAEILREERRQHEQKSGRRSSKTGSQHRIGNRKERNAIKEGRQELQGVMSLSQ